VALAAASLTVTTQKLITMPGGKNRVSEI